MACKYESYAAAAVEELFEERIGEKGEGAVAEQRMQHPSGQGLASTLIDNQRMQQSSGPGLASALIVVANRLPLTVTKDAATNEYNFKTSSGGLVSALTNVRSKVPFKWLGWLGQAIPAEDQPRVRAQLLKEHSCIPVFLPEEIAGDFYNGCCNDIIWPNFHVEVSTDTVFDPTGKLWNAYRAANVLFAKTVLSVARKQDLIFLHDYHLMLLPYLLRRYLGEEAVISWFLHTPFPSSEIARALPVRGEILRGLLAADQLGFHVADYSRHFLSSCQCLLPNIVSATPSCITASATNADGSTTISKTRLIVDPIGIEPEVFEATATSPECQARIKELAEKFGGVGQGGKGGKKIIVAVDRLDLIKGLVQRMLGLETFFRLYPQWIGKVVFVQVAVPSRTDVPAYIKLTRDLNTLVARINTSFGDLSSGYTPIQYLYRSVTPVELVALYAAADVCLVSSIRDGLNLVSEEFVACQRFPTPNRSAPGVIILSEFAGVAQSLGSGALRINPWAPSEIASSLDEALSMPAEEKTRRFSLMNDYIRVFTSQKWAETFVDGMKAIQAEKMEKLSIGKGPKAASTLLAPAPSSAPSGQPSQPASSGAPLSLSPQEDDEEGAAERHEQNESLACAIQELSEVNKEEKA